MKKLLHLYLLLISVNATAQNWQCVNAGEVRYFINDDNYLRASAIDSFKVIGADSILYPFRVVRGAAYYNPGPSLYLGGSWLGDKIIIQSADSSNLILNAFGDTILLKTTAHLGDAWLMMKDTLDIEFWATVTREDTMTVLDRLDSIKTITIIAKQGTKILYTNPSNSRTITLSKNHGFTKVFELYFFPFRIPGSSAYGLYTYDMLFDEGNGGKSDFKDFNLINFHNPHLSEIFNYNLADRLEHYFYEWPVSGAPDRKYILDQVVKKVTNAGSTEYEFYRTTEQYYDNKYYFSDSHYKINVDTSLWLTHLPETFSPIGVDCIYYYPDDTSLCHKSNIYRSGTFKYSALPSTGNNLYYPNREKLYKIGIGQINDYYKDHYVNAFSTQWTRNLVYYDLSNTPCGLPKWPDNIQTINPENQIDIYPNPANDIITIDLDNTGNEASQLILRDLMGNTMRSINTIKKKITINLKEIPPGVYNLALQTPGGIFNKKIVIKH